MQLTPAVFNVLTAARMNALATKDRCEALVRVVDDPAAEADSQTKHEAAQALDSATKTLDEIAEVAAKFGLA